MAITISTAKSVPGTMSLWCRYLLISCAATAFLGVNIQTASAGEALDQSISLDIAANTRLEDALIEWGLKARMTVMINTPTVDRLLLHRIRGTLSARNALTLLLKDSGLSYTTDGETIRVIPAANLVRSSLRAIQLASANTREVTSDSVSEEESTESTSNRNGTPRDDISEVIVTAQKREERLQDVPIPLAAISANTLVDNNLVRLQDFYSQVPGLSVAPGIQSGQAISIRGLTTGGGTVGVTIDDMPIGGHGAGAGLISDIDPGDLARIEVLRGPQGTLYGASSMGGLVKYVTADPSTDAVSGRIEAGTSSVYNGAELGYVARASANLPLDNDLAIRVSAFTRRDPGYIDNPILGIDGINEDYASGGHLAFLWKPLETLSLKLNALYQTVHGSGTNDDSTRENITGLSETLGYLQQGYIRGAGPYDWKAQAYSLTLTDRIGNIDLTSVTGYSSMASADTNDVTSNLGGLISSLYPVGGALLLDNHRDNKFDQEIRLSAPIGHLFDVLLGAFYTHEDSPFVQIVSPTNTSTGTAAGQFLYNTFPTTYAEYAGFADLTYHATDRFDIQVGGRESHISETYNQAFIGPYDTLIQEPDPYIIPEARASANSFTYLFTPRFKLSADLMAYARVASGFRPGGPNPGVGNGVPLEYQPDKTYNYEMGTKGDFLDHIISFDASLYYIDWKNIQVGLTDPRTHNAYTGNAGAATSKGVELSAELRPISGLTVSSWFAWNNATLTEQPANSALAPDVGEPLPWAPRFSGNLSVNKEFALGPRMTGFVGGAVSYVGDRKDVFINGSSQRQDLPAYAKTDLHASAKYDSLTVNLYVNNVTNRDGLLTGGLGNPISDSFFYIQPRTVGLSLSKTF